MGSRKTPGAYIAEKNAFPDSVVEVETAVPAFIGYTEKASHQGLDLTHKPRRISSMAEFQEFFGHGPLDRYVRFTLAEASQTSPSSPDGLNPFARRDAPALNLGSSSYTLTQVDGFYFLYHAMVHFFQNGGGPCYVVSVGPYKANERPDRNLFEQALLELTKEPEPTMVVIPDAVAMECGECYALQQSVISHCGSAMKNRIALLDVWEGYRDRQDGIDVVAQFRDHIGTGTLGFAVAYYPWVNADVVQERDLSYIHLDGAGRALLAEVIQGKSGSAHLGDDAATQDLLAKTLSAASPFYNAIITEMARRLNVLPPGAAMAGIYAMVDNARGVWKAPANVSLNGVSSPTVHISSEQVEDLSVSPQGKSLNAIRSIPGAGVLVWGARTLDGNSLDWRYVNVRRTMIMLEESIRLAAKAMVFEPNVANTWVTVKRMITHFLTGIWKRGGLAGAVPEEAFNVMCGLGETMTPDDILEGIMRVTVLVAISRPAEFIEITFQQQMQKS